MHLYLPARQIRFFIGNLEYLQDVFSSLLLSQHQGNMVDVADVMYTQHIGHRDIAERGNLLLGFLDIIGNTHHTQAQEDWQFCRSRSREINQLHEVPSQSFE